MKIERLRTIRVNKSGSHPWGTGNANNYLFVKVDTDEGISGLGEAFHSLDEPIEAAVVKFERSLVREDPNAISRN